MTRARTRETSLSVSETDVRHLRSFVAIVEAGGFSQAQLPLGLSQSTISNQIGALEERLGFSLCMRGRGGFRLTMKGEVVYRSAVELIGRLDSFREHMTDLKQFMLGRLRIGLLQGIEPFSFAPLAEAFARYKKLAPEVVLELSCAGQDTLLHELEKNRLDLAVGLSPQVHDFTSRSLGRQSLVLCTVQGHGLLTGTPDEIVRDLPNFPLVLDDSLFDIQRARLPPTDNVARVSDLAGKIALLGTLQGVAYLPRELLGAPAGAGLAAIHLPGSEIDLGITVFRRRGQPTRVVATFMGLLPEAAVAVAAREKR